MQKLAAQTDSVESLRASRDHTILVKKHIDLLNAGAKNLNLSMYRKQCAKRNERIFRKHQAIDDNVSRLREELQENSVYYQTYQQGSQGQQGGEPMYVGSSRLPLNVANPLLKDVSLYFCGVKKSYRAAKGANSIGAR